MKNFSKIITKNTFVPRSSRFYSSSVPVNNMGSIINKKHLKRISNKDEGVNAGGIYDSKGIPLLLKYNELHENLDPEQYRNDLKDKTWIDMNIASRKEIITAMYFKEFAKQNNIPILIPETGLSYKIDNKGSFIEGVLSKLENRLNPSTNIHRELYSEYIYELLINKEHIKDLHKMFTALSIMRAYDSIGAGHRNLGFVEDKGKKYLWMCDFGVALQEVPPGKGWASGNFNNVYIAIQKIMGIDNKIFQLLESPEYIDSYIPSERAAKTYFQILPMSAITDINLLTERKVKKCFDIMDRIPNEYKDYSQCIEYQQRLSQEREFYESRVLQRQEDVEKLQKALNVVYPKQEFEHNKLMLPPILPFLELYQEYGEKNISEEQKIAIREKMEKLIPQERKDVFESIYNNKIISEKSKIETNNIIKERDKIITKEGNNVGMIK